MWMEAETEIIIKKNKKNLISFIHSSTHLSYTKINHFNSEVVFERVCCLLLISVLINVVSFTLLISTQQQHMNEIIVVGLLSLAVIVLKLIVEWQRVNQCARLKVKLIMTD